MRFAVIEFNSKSGQIWKHSDARPNYLANPQTEIDATSFGCYVSALQGEHIPLRPLIIGPLSQASYFRRISRRAYHKIRGRYPQTFSLDYFKSFDSLLVVYDIYTGPEITAFTRRLRKTFPHLVIIGVPTQPYGIITNYWQSHPEIKADLIKFISLCQAFLTIVAGTKLAWQALTKTPVHYLPQPYPVEYASRHFKPLEQKQPVIYLAGVTDRYDIKRGHRLAAKLKAMFPAYSIQLTDIPGQVLDTVLLSGTNFEIIPFMLWPDHLNYLNDVKLVINTDYTQTRGRVQADCAAVGTPSIGADSDGQRDLFPALIANDHTSLDILFNQAIHLLNDDNYYRETVSQASQRLTNYSYQKSAERLTALISSLKNK